MYVHYLLANKLGQDSPSTHPERLSTQFIFQLTKAGAQSQYERTDMRDNLHNYSQQLSIPPGLEDTKWMLMTIFCIVDNFVHVLSLFEDNLLLNFEYF